MMHISKKYKKERKKIRQNCINTEIFKTVNSIILKRSEKEREKCTNADPVVRSSKNSVDTPPKMMETTKLCGD